MQNYRNTQLAVFCDLLELEHERLETCPHGLHKEHVVLLGEGDKGAQLCCIHSHWLFAKDVFLRKQCITGIFVVGCVRSPYRRNINTSETNALFETCRYIWPAHSTRQVVIE